MFAHRCFRNCKVAFNSLYVYLKKSVRNIYLRIIYENIFSQDVICYEYCKQNKFKKYFYRSIYFIIKKILLSCKLLIVIIKICIFLLSLYLLLPIAFRKNFNKVSNACHIVSICCKLCIMRIMMTMYQVQQECV